MRRREGYNQWRGRMAIRGVLLALLAGGAWELATGAEATTNPAAKAAAELERAKQYIADHEAAQQEARDADKGGLFELFSGESKAPTVTPFKVPSFSGGAPKHERRAAALVVGRGLDSDGLFRAISNCYPSTSHWRPELTINASASSGYSSTTNDLSSYSWSTGAAIGDHYIELVASLPLWSASEKSRERDRELMRRQQAADLIGQLGQALAERGQAVREYGLYRALEARSAKRVQEGLADTAEQVDYLAKVAAAHGASVAAHSAIERSRLAMLAQCRPDARDRIDAYIKRATELEPPK